jgi:methionyl-tRNA formyltransferase
MRVAIIGQAAFGAAVYERLRDAGHEIVGVFTAPEGRRPDPLAEAARADGVRVEQTAHWQRKGVVVDAVFETYASTKPELNVMAFVTQIIPGKVLDFPAKGTIQYHPSLLPKHRGRSAINHAIIQGDAETGCTIFWVDEGIDTGPVLLQKRCMIRENDTINSLYRDQLFQMGIDGLHEGVELVVKGEAPRIVQDESQATYEAPWEGDAARIDWSQAAPRVHDLIRGSDRQPGAWSLVGDAKVTLYGSVKVEPETEAGGEPGVVLSVEKAGVTVRCGRGAVRLDTAMAKAGKRVPAAEWARAAGVGPGTLLT